VAAKNALDGSPVYLHLDVDVLDPEAFPVQDPVPGGLAPEKLYDLFEAVVEDSDLIGLEITAFGVPDDRTVQGEAAETALRVIEPLLDTISEVADVHG
jgi:arginase family enzyme